MIRTTLVFAALLLAVSGCAGTQLSMTGTVCGQDVQLQMVDRKDRSEFALDVTCPDGGGAHIASAESSTSSVLQAQAALLQTLAGLVAQLAAGSPAAMTWKEVMPHSALSEHDDKTMAGVGMSADVRRSTARGVALERLAYTVEAEHRL